MSVRDKQSKKALIKYLKRGKEQRLFQCITNFVKENLDSKIHSVYVGKYDMDELVNREAKASYEDTFFWECDEKLK